MPDVYKQSGIHKFKLNFAEFLYCIAYITLAICIVMRFFFKKINRPTIIRSVFMLALLLYCFVDNVLALIGVFRQSHYTGLINCCILFLYVRTIRVTWGQIMRVLYKTLPLLGIIITFFIFYSYIGFVLFSTVHTYNATYFSSLPASFKYVFIMFTLSNYPTISYPYYNESYFYNFYFIIFIMVALYLFMNFLLAVIYNNYMMQLSKESAEFEDARDLYFEGRFDAIDKHSKGYLTVD